MICSRCDPAHESQDLPGTDQYDAVELRSYRDVRETAPPKVAFVAPTVEIFRRETMRITPNNRLVIESKLCPPGHNVNMPNCFNRTHLHAHGRWLSPAGNSDNVADQHQSGHAIRPAGLHLLCAHAIPALHRRLRAALPYTRGMMQNVSIGIPDGRRSQH